MSVTDAVLTEIAGHTCWIRLNRPDKLNALDSATMAGLLDAIDAAEGNDDVRVLVVTGNGRAFSAGGDLSAFHDQLGDRRYDDVVDGVRASSATLERLAACGKPTVAAVNGLAVAGGLEIILCCDFVIAADGVLIGDGHLRYGVLPGGGGSVRLVKKLPVNIAKWMLMTGSLLPAERLAHWGLVNELVPAEHLVARVEEIADRLAALSPLALAHVKRVADWAVDGPTLAALHQEQDAFRAYVGSEDFREGVSAFSERREPRFEGR